jgi:hypothetical protein
MFKFTFGRPLIGLFTALLLAFSTFLTGCGGSSSTTDAISAANLSEDQGQVLVSLTDAEGDFLTYQVDVTAITLMHSDGTQVDLLPETTSVDFAQYVDTSELLSVTSAPRGVYDSASISLDFGNSVITVQDESGNPVVASVVDEDGTAVSELTVQLNFNGNEHFVVNPRKIAHVTLDFDLDASNSIELTETGAVVTVSPVLMADTQHKDPKPFRLRGLLQEVDSETQSFTLDLRPFRKRHGRFGSTDVYVDDTTNYEIDGEVTANDQGLAALAELDAEASVVVSGIWSKEEHTFTATEVLAGSSVAWNNIDVLRGTVVARSENTLTVKGALVELSSGHARFNDTLTLTIADTTSVHKYGEEADSATISIGSAIHATGDVISDTEMDASAGLVRLRKVSVSGSVISTEEGLAIDVALIDGRRPDVFDFTGTGQSAEQDTNAAEYEIDTAELNTEHLAVNDPVRIRGYVNDFGAAPADFIAHTLVGARHMKAGLSIDYGRKGSTTAVQQNTEAGLQLSLADTGRHHHVGRGGMPLDMHNLDTMPLVVPAEGEGIYSITIDDQIEVYLDYSEFATALDDYLANGMIVVRFDAHGQYNAENNTFESARLRIRLTSAED